MIDLRAPISGRTPRHSASYAFKRNCMNKWYSTFKSDGRFDDDMWNSKATIQRIKRTVSSFSRKAWLMIISSQFLKVCSAVLFILEPWYTSRTTFLRRCSYFWGVCRRLFGASEDLGEKYITIVCKWKCITEMENDKVEEGDVRIGTEQGGGDELT